ncbi:MAG: sugar ABC transporter substrate-binding protein [Acidimicrobiales bacterium]
MPISTRLKEAPPKGKTIVYIQCMEPQCHDVATGVGAAAHAVGWKYKHLSFDESNPATLVSALKQALLYKPTIVSFNAMPESTWSSVLPSYKSANVKIVPIETGPTTIAGPVISAIGNDGAVQGTILANWAISSSNGSAHVLLVNVPAFALFNGFITSFNKTMTSECSSCVVTSLDATVSEQANNQITPAVVAAIQRDPSINYVIATDGVMIPALPTALSAASISKITIGSGLSTQENQQDIMAGTETAGTAGNFQYLGWQVVDNAARKLEGMRIGANGGGMPEELLLKSNLKTASESADIPANFGGLFKRLWRVG